jgi:hypothetical protein
MTYAAYLRIYEPVSAFHEPDRSRWPAYAASAARPRRRDTLIAEYAEALRLCGDQSVAEMRAAIDGAARDEWELAATMYMRAHNRWRVLAEFGLAN